MKTGGMLVIGAGYSRINGQNGRQTLHREQKNIQVGMGKMVEVLGCCIHKLYDSHIFLFLSLRSVLGGFSDAIRCPSLFLFNLMYPKFQVKNIIVAKKIKKTQDLIHQTFNNYKRHLKLKAIAFLVHLGRREILQSCHSCIFIHTINAGPNFLQSNAKC